MVVYNPSGVVLVLAVRLSHRRLGPRAGIRLLRVERKNQRIRIRASAKGNALVRVNLVRIAHAHKRTRPLRTPKLEPCLSLPPPNRACGRGRKREHLRTCGRSGSGSYVTDPLAGRALLRSSMCMLELAGSLLSRPFTSSNRDAYLDVASYSRKRSSSSSNHAKG